MDWTRLLSLKTQAERELEPEYFDIYRISDFEKDYKTIISSAAFRRLEDKTQVFPLDKSDFVRTRLTHSVEVSTIARQLGIMATKNSSNHCPQIFKDQPQIAEGIASVLSCAGLLHDLGNPPFGHFGEVVIGDWFKDAFKKDAFTYKGHLVREVLSPRMQKDLCSFEGNAQALRILSKIQANPQGYDVNLTYAVINTLIKYPTDSLSVNTNSLDVKMHKLGYYYAEEALFTDVCRTTGTEIGDHTYVRHPLTFLMEAADDIAYSTSDLEDALKKGMFTVDEFIEYFEREMESIPEGVGHKSKELIDDLKARLSQGKRNQEHDLTAFQKWSEFVKKWFMYVVSFSFSKNYGKIMAGTYGRDLFYETFHQYSVDILKGAMVRFVFNDEEILRLELSAKKILSSLLDDLVDAVVHWEEEDETFRLTKTQRKLVHIISENYKTDYLNNCLGDEAERLYRRFLMVTDYISGMTDSYAKDLYRDLNGIN